jgi:hypothetical protein
LGYSGGWVMTLYYFTLESGYGEEFTVMADNIIDAQNSVMWYLWEELRKDPTSEYEKERFNKWYESNKSNSVPKGYIIKEFGQKEVIATEIS